MGSANGTYDKTRKRMDIKYIDSSLQKLSVEVIWLPNLSPKSRARVTTYKSKTELHWGEHKILKRNLECGMMEYVNYSLW